VRFPDGRPSKYFYWDDLAGRRMRPEVFDSATAEEQAKSLARAEQDNLQRHTPYVGLRSGGGSHHRPERHNLDHFFASCRHTVRALARFDLEEAGTSIQMVVSEN
jgi:hypothetical protein